MNSFRGSSKAKIMLEKLKDSPNVPRKKAKFFNFMKNSFKYLDMNLLEEVWKVIDHFEENNISTNSSNLKNDLVRKRSQEQIEDNETVDNDANKKMKITNDVSIHGLQRNKFDWFESIKKEILKNENQIIQFKKLSQKVKN